jgi:hypothetical protein
VDESCTGRADVCSAWLADWLRTRPRSPQLSQRLARWRETKLGEPIRSKDVQDFAALLAGQLPAGAVDAAEAARFNALVRSYAQPGIALDGRPLLSLWSRCRPPPGDAACERGLVEALALVGGAEASAQ